MKKAFYVITSLIVIVLVVLAATGVFKKDSQQWNVITSKDELVIGAILPLSGDFAEQGEAFLAGLQLGIHEANELGTFDQTLRLVVEDSGLEPGKSLSAATKLLYTDNIDVAMTSVSTEILATGHLFEKEEVPAFVLWESSEDIENVGDYTFGIGIWIPSAAQKAAEFAYNDLGLRNIAAVYSRDNEWSTLIIEIFEDHFNQLGGHASLESLPANDDDARSVLSKIKQGNFDGVYAPIASNVHGFFRQYSELDIDLPLITSDILFENHLADLGEQLDGVYQTQTPTPDNPKTQSMAAAYQKLFGEETDQTLIVAWGYDAIGLVAEALENGATDSISIANKLYEIKNYPGATGNISISPEGSWRVMESVYVIKDGDFELVAE